MPKTLRIVGVIVPNDYKWYYDFFDMDNTCPADVEAAIAEANGDMLTVEINSPGGEIASGSTIYALLRKYDEQNPGKLTLQVMGEACSAASVIAMAGYCEMAPTAMMMVHNVSQTVQGNHRDMEKAAEDLVLADHALCAAYVAKTGMSEDEVIAMMEHTTWLPAAKAKELGLIDKIMFEDGPAVTPMAASTFQLPTLEQMAAVKRAMEAEQTPPPESDDHKAEARARLNLLTLKGAKT